MLPQFESNIIYILDTETTGLDGRPYDEILEISIVKLDLKTRKIETELNAIINYPIDDKIKNSWVIQNNIISIQEIELGRDLEEIKRITQTILKEKYWTCFNAAFDYEKFLYYWDIHTPVFCLMLEYTDILKIRQYNNWGYKYKWPNLQEAYKRCFPNNIEQNHRALDDTKMAAELCLRLYDMKTWENKILKAINFNNELKLKYKNFKNEISERTVKPLSYEDFQMKGYCYLRKEERNFNLYAIQELKGV